MLVDVLQFQTYSILEQQKDVIASEAVNLMNSNHAVRFLTKGPYVRFVAIRYIC
jgi:hypothetical protein